MTKIITYAQNREDLILNELLKGVERGFYVDVGTNHSTIDSVTKIFYDKGWSGINIEPSPSLYRAIAKDRTRDINLNIGISSKKGTLKFREYVGSGLSTFSKEMKDQYALNPNSSTKDYNDYSVDVITLEQALDKYLPMNQIVDFLKIDVEGYEFEVLSGNNWEKYRPKVICIEANHIDKDWSHIIINNNYIKIFNDGLNDYYVAKEHKEIADSFYYPNILLGPQVISYSCSLEINLLEAELKSCLTQSQKLELENQILHEKIYPLKYQIGTMNNEIQKNKRLRNQLFNIVKTVDTIIIIQLNKLNRTHTTTRVRQSKNSDYYANATTEELRKKVWINDLNHLGLGSLRAVESRSILYKMIFGLYIFLKRAIKAIAQMAWHVVKKIKGKS